MSTGLGTNLGTGLGAPIGTGLGTGFGTGLGMGMPMGNRGAPSLGALSTQVALQQPRMEMRRGTLCWFEILYPLTTLLPSLFF